MCVYSITLFLKVRSSLVQVESDLYIHAPNLALLYCT